MLDTKTFSVASEQWRTSDRSEPSISVMMANLAEETQQAQGPQKAKEAIR